MEGSVDADIIATANAIPMITQSLFLKIRPGVLCIKLGKDMSLPRIKTNLIG
jgi:hypothetical protein